MNRWVPLLFFPPWKSGSWSLQVHVHVSMPVSFLSFPQFSMCVSFSRSSSNSFQLAARIENCSKNPVHVLWHSLQTIPKHHFFQLYCKYHCIPLNIFFLFLLLLLFKTVCLTQPIATSIIKICAVIIQLSDSYETHFHILCACKSQLK